MNRAPISPALAVLSALLWLVIIKGGALLAEAISRRGSARP